MILVTEQRGGGEKKFRLAARYKTGFPLSLRHTLSEPALLHDLHQRPDTSLRLRLETVDRDFENPRLARLNLFRFFLLFSLRPRVSLVVDEISLRRRNRIARYFLLNFFRLLLWHSVENCSVIGNTIASGMSRL